MREMYLVIQSDTTLGRSNESPHALELTELVTWLCRAVMLVGTLCPRMCITCITGRLRGYHRKWRWIIRLGFAVNAFASIGVRASQPSI